MATIRRLSDEDVRAIFECVHNNMLPPVHLQFQMVPVGPEGLRLSPPSYQFEGMNVKCRCMIGMCTFHSRYLSHSLDGLYVLMKPQKKKAHPSEQPKVPSLLVNYVMQDFPCATCPWSLSGPQFPQPTAIQQRYCYPKGDPEYSSRKGGALWTMYGADGKENLEYRLLHVYFSAKRAVNKGMTSDYSTPTKRVKTSPHEEFPARFPSSTPSPTFSPMPYSSESPPSPTISPIPYRSNFVSPFEQEHTFHPMPDNSPLRPRILAAESRDDDHSHGEHSMDDLDPFHFDMDTLSMQELEDACWNDFLLPPSDISHEDRLRSLALGLERVHSCAIEKIMQAPASEQASLVSLFASWARQVAHHPLSDPNCEQV
jgi:hypothetical protein